MWRFDATEIVELVRLPEAHITDGAGRALHHGNGICANGFIDFIAPLCEFFRCEVFGEERQAFLGSCTERKCEDCDKELIFSWWPPKQGYHGLSFCKNLPTYWVHCRTKSRLANF